MKQRIVYCLLFVFIFSGNLALAQNQSDTQAYSPLDTVLAPKGEEQPDPTVPASVEYNQQANTSALLLAKTREEPFSLVTLLRGLLGMVEIGRAHV